MGLLDASEEPNSKTLRYAVTGVALVILLSFGLWYFVFLRFFEPEKHTVEHFMDAVVAGKLPGAYQIWKPHGASYTFQGFPGRLGRDGLLRSRQELSDRSAAARRAMAAA